MAGGRFVTLGSAADRRRVSAFPFGTLFGYRRRVAPDDETKTADALPVDVKRLPALSIAWWKFRRNGPPPQPVYVLEPKELLEPALVTEIRLGSGRMEVFIGRAVDGATDIQLTSPEREVSKRHARLFAQGPASVKIQALAAKNGTEVTSSSAPFPYLHELTTGSSSEVREGVLIRIARDFLGEVVGGTSDDERHWRRRVSHLGDELSALHQPVELKLVQAVCAAPWFVDRAVRRGILADAEKRRLSSAASTLLLEHVRPPPDFEIPGFESADRRIWFVRFAGHRFGPLRLRGMWFLAEAVREPLRRWDVLELDRAYYHDGANVHRGDAGVKIDMKAALELRERLDEIDGEIDEAQSYHDSGRLDRLQLERTRIEDQLRGLGLGGRPRRADSDKERARSRVKHVVDRALEAIEKCDRALGKRLHASIHTGNEIFFDPQQFCNAADPGHLAASRP